jgi:hypothetical protein
MCGPPHLQERHKAEGEGELKMEVERRIKEGEMAVAEGGKSIGVSEEMKKRIAKYVELKAGQQQEIAQRIPLGGCVCTVEAVERWKSIGGLNILGSKVRLIWNWRGQPQGRGRKCRTVNGEKEEKAYGELIEKMLKQKVIEEVGEGRVRYFNHTFLLKKSDGSFRFVLDAKLLNQYLMLPHYKNEDIRTVLDLLQPGDLMVKFDLESAYHQIAMTEEAASYPGFAVGARYFRFLALPFGLATAPFLFTKIMKPVVTWIRSKWRGVMYLDDGIVLFRRVEEAEKGIKEIVEMLMSLNIRISFKKCELVPTRVIKFLGWIVDSENMILRVPNEKEKAGRRTVKAWKGRVAQEAVAKIRTLASLIGTLSSLALAVQQAHLRLSCCQAVKDEAVRLNGWEGKVKMRKEMMPELEWWDKKLETGIWMAIKTFSPSIVVTTDASPIGWGAQIQGEKECRLVTRN